VGVAVLDDHVFRYVAAQHENGEYYLTDMIDQLSRDATVAVLKTDLWLPIGYPSDLQRAAGFLNTSH
jgi:dTDP-glucose pyrophosphorylase